MPTLTNKVYTTAALIGKFLNITAPADADVLEFILTAQKIIDDYTQKNFKADTSASARVYDGNDEQELLIDDCVEISTVEQGVDFWGDSFNTIASSGIDSYRTDPANRSVGGITLPISKLILRQRVWTKGSQNNRITAKWGYTVAPPEDIQMVATIIAAGLYNYNRGGVGDIKSEKIGNYAVTYANDEGNNSFGDFQKAMMVLDSYKEFSL